MTDMPEARRIADQVFMDYYGRRAAEISGVRDGEGQRPSAGMARGPVDLVEITERKPDGTIENKTVLGRKTARTRLPRVLSELDPNDGRRRAAELFAASVEALGASGGTSFLSEGSGGFPSDGGVIGRQKAAECVRRCRMVLRSIDPFPSYRVTGKRRKITAETLTESISVDGKGIVAVLKGHGWSGDIRNRKALRYYTHMVLDHLAVELGFRSKKSG